MNLFQRLKIWKDLKALEARAREEPSPSTFVDLGQVYINLGTAERTLQVAEEGLALFPDSDELRKLRRFAMKSQLNSRINDLRARLNKGPAPRLYRELAGLYLEKGDFGSVHGTCEECIRRFPDDGETWLILGQARLTNFYRDLSAREGLESVRCLQKATGLAPDNSKAHRLIAEVLFRVGALTPAREHLEVLVRLQPGESEAAAMLTQMGEAEDKGADLDICFHNVEATGTLPNRPPSARPVTGPKGSRGGNDDSMARIRDSLAQIAETVGVRKATYIKGSRAMVKGEIRDGRDAFLRVVRITSRAAQRFARRLDIGNFNKGVLQGDFGYICVCSFGEVVAAVQCDDRALAERLLVDLQELVAGSLFVAGGAKR